MRKNSVTRGVIVVLTMIATLLGTVTAANAEPTAHQEGSAYTASTAEEPPEIKIIGGENATKPGVVSLQSVNAQGDGYHECGGLLVAETTVLTAAHCAPYFTQARAGSLLWQEGETAAVKQVIKHPSYTGETPLGDIAVVQLAKPLGVEPFSIGLAGWPGTTVLLQGWGTTCDVDISDLACREAIPDYLQQLELERLRHRPCAEALTDPETGVNYYARHMLCYISADRKYAQACMGDSGSPQFRTFRTFRSEEWVAVSLVSADGDSLKFHKHLCSTSPDGKPGKMMATKIWPYLPWILQTVSTYSRADVREITSRLRFSLAA